MKKLLITAALVIGVVAAVVRTAPAQDGSPSNGSAGDPGNSGAGTSDAGTIAANAPLGDCTQFPKGADPTILSAYDVCVAIANAASAVDAGMVIAVTDRQGDVLAVYQKNNAPALTRPNYGQEATVPRADANEVAVALARTASFFSNDNAPLTSRTVRFISGVHFPPGIMFTANADLYGIENTNRGCSFNTTFLPGKYIPRATSILDPTKPGLGIMTGKADFHDSVSTAVNPGGIPLFRVVNGGDVVLGGVGVVAGSADNPDYQVSEYAAAVGAGFIPGALPNPFSIIIPAPGVVIVGGIALPEIFQTSLPAGHGTGTPDGQFMSIPTVSANQPQPSDPAPALIAQPQASPGFAGENNLIAITGGTTTAANPNPLSVAEVTSIVANAVFTANSIRGVIRLPLGTRSHMVIAVSDLDGRLLALNRMPDATIFSIDVAVAKSRNVIWFTNNPQPDLPGYNKPGIAITNRTISFGAQPFFPPGIDTSDPAPNFPTPGPFFPLFLYDTANPCTQGVNQPNPGGTGTPTTFNNNISGIVFFPGAVPLYRNGVMVGGLGISGDGVDQDDYVTNGGAQGFLAPEAIRADNVFIRGVRMPYQKYPRNPTD